jgi:U3 small nucleolar RNA-associated protein 7
MTIDKYLRETSANPINKIEKYLRESSSIPIKKIQDKKLKSYLKTFHSKAKSAATDTLHSELLMTENAGFLIADQMENTWKVKQCQLNSHVDINTARKMFDLRLEDFGPYSLDYTTNGRY